MQNKPNGCGPTWLPDWFPDGPDGKAFTPACNQHDEDYKKGGNMIDKIKADWRLLISAIQSVRYMDLKNRILGYLMAVIYFIAVFTFGWYKSFTWRK